MYTKVKTAEEIQSMREAGGMLAAVLNVLDQKAEAGMTSAEAADLAGRELKKLGGKPSFLGVPGGKGVIDFPSVICISVNDAVVHGIPGSTEFKDGDIVSFDFGVTINNMITDSAFSKIIGTGTKQVQDLVAKTEQSLMAGIDAIQNGAKTGDMASAIEAVLKKNNLGIVRDLVGHGVGHELHEEPNFPNYGTAGTGPSVKTGMTICLEPMATIGNHHVTLDDDGWTIRTRDRSLSAHFEHTILVTEDGAEVLTAR